MLEVYDRVIMSHNIKTLLMLALLALSLLWVMEKINKVRADMLNQQGLRFLNEMRGEVFDLSFYKGVKTNKPFNPTYLDQLTRLSQFFSSNPFVSLLDLPFALIFLLLIYCMSTTLGNLTLLVTLIIAGIAILNERGTHPRLLMANRLVGDSQVVLNNVLKNAEVIKAMNMSAALVQRWKAKHFDYIHYQSQASLSATYFQSYSRLLQQILGSAILGLSCWLLLEGDFSIGASGMIVASILASRFTSPMVQIITGWKTITNALDAFNQLQQLESDFSTEQSTIQLPKPRGDLSVENASIRIADSERFILKQINFSIRAGRSLAVIGPSGSGKTTLAKLVVGALAPDLGSVRLDSAALFDWNKANLGRHIGYLAQDVELFEGTVAENIARFAEVDEAAVNQAITLAGLDDFICSLADGIHTRLDGGVRLPGGKRQLLGLARAIYQAPRLVVLDEPSSNLDKAGEAALEKTLAFLKQQQSTVVLITHHKGYLSLVDNIVVLMNGEVRLGGTRDEVLSKLQAPSTSPKVTQTIEKLSS